MMTDRVMKWLTTRGIDVELADRLGLASVKRGRGEALMIPTLRNGEVVSRKYRIFDGSNKDPNQKWSSDEGGETCFWNVDVLSDRSLDKQPLIITEGHWDAMAAIQCGFQRVISVPNGANGNYDYIPDMDDKRFPQIILATDDDGPGRQLMHDLSIRFGRYRCKFVSYAPTGLDDSSYAKDLNDVLLRDGSDGLCRVLHGAEFMAVPGLYFLSKMAPLPEETIYDIGSEERGLRMLAQNYRMRLGDLTVLTGIPGLGKSTFVADVCCRVADFYGLRVAWASFEQRPQIDQRRFFRSWYKGHAEGYRDDAMADAWTDDHHLIIASEGRSVTLAWLMEAVTASIVRYGCKIVVIDPWNEIEHTRDRSETETEYTGRAIHDLKHFAMEYGVHLIIVAHPAKMQKVNGKYLMPTLYDISGSSHFYNKADIGIIVHREDKDSSIIRVQKVKHHGVIGCPGEVSVSFNRTTQHFTENERLS
jgi:twinkle protein